MQKVNRDMAQYFGAIDVQKGDQTTNVRNEAGVLKNIKKIIGLVYNKEDEVIVIENDVARVSFKLQCVPVLFFFPSLSVFSPRCRFITSPLPAVA
jgi:hypothetical protein